MGATKPALVAGHICLDIIPQLSRTTQEQFEKTFLPGHLLEVGPVAFSTGGAVSNTGLALSRLGIQTDLMGKVGDDLFGHAVRQIVGSNGSHLAQGMLVDETVSTSYTIIINPPGVDRIFLHCPGANDAFGAEDLRYDQVAESALFHFGYPPLMRRMFQNGGVELVEMYRRVREMGVTTSLDLAVPDPSSAAGRADWAAILRAVMPYVDVFLPNIEETLFMLRRNTFEAFSQAAGGISFQHLVTPGLLSDLSGELLGMGARIVGFKLGDRGLYVRTADRAAIASMGRARPEHPGDWAERELWAPCFKVDVAGTTGAGDATVAGFLSALLRDLSLEEALTAAVAVGASNVEAPDALGGIRSWADTRLRIDAGWARHELSLSAPGWRFDERNGLWVGGGSSA